jgi:transcription-repair coupling factor (superfamily II helicase)
MPGGDKLYVPVENIDVLSRYGRESEGVRSTPDGSAARRGSAQVAMKERIREIAGELIKDRRRARAPAGRRHGAGLPGFAAFVDRFPMRRRGPGPRDPPT